MTDNVKDLFVERISKLFNAIVEHYLLTLNKILSEEIKKHIALLDEFIKVIDDINSNNRFKDEKENKIDKFKQELIRNYTELVSMYKNMDEPFLLFVCGMGKFGKSTLINAMIGEPIAEIDVLPKTWKIDIFKYSNTDNKEVIIKYYNGEEDRLSFEKAKELLETEELKRKESEKKIYSEIKKKKEANWPIEKLEEYEEYLKKNHLYESPVIETIWPYKNNSPLKEFCLVDTPGLRQKLETKVVHSAREFASKADGILWLLSAEVITSEKSKDMLDEIKQFRDSLNQSHNNIIGVINRIDKIQEQGGKEKVDKVIEFAEKEFSKYFIDLVPISAKLAYESILNNDDEKGRKSNIDQLIYKINHNFKTNGHWIKFLSKSSGCKNIVNNIQNLVDEQIKIIETSKSELEKRKKYLNDTVEEKNKSFENRLDLKIKDYEDSVLLNIRDKTSKLFDIKNLINKLFGVNIEEKQKEIIKEEILEINKLEILDEFIKSEQNKLIDFYKSSYKDFLFSPYKYLSPDEIKFEIDKMELNNIVSQEFEDIKGVEVATGIATGIGIILLPDIIAIILGLLYYRWKKGKEIQEVQDKLKQQLDEICIMIKDKSINTYQKIIDKTKKNLENILFTTYEKIYLPPDKIDFFLKNLYEIKQKMIYSEIDIDLKEFLCIGAKKSEYKKNSNKF